MRLQFSSENHLRPSFTIMFTSRKAVLALAAAAAAVDQAAAFAPATGSLRLRVPRAHAAVCTASSPLAAEANAASTLKMSSSMSEKYGHLRGADVEPCGAAVERFYKLFGKPVLALSVVEHFTHALAPLSAPCA